MATPPDPVPDLNWAPARVRALGERVLDLWEELLQRLPELPVHRGQRREEVRAAVALPIPEEPLSEDALVDHLRKVMLEYSMYLGHPSFFAYINGAGTAPGALADLVAAAINQNMGGWQLAPAGTEIEVHLTNWLARQFGLPADSGGGIMFTGGAMANYVGLKLARDARCGWDVRKEGVAAGPGLALYVSTEAHATIGRAVDMLGIGSNALRKIPVDESCRIRVDLLRQAIEEDLARGIKPLAIVGMGGSTGTGAVDPLAELAELAERYRMWFHVDAAYGGGALFSDELKPLLAGIERADSITFDPHKWMYIPHSSGCLLVRDVRYLDESFTVAANYIHQDKERTGRGADYSMMGPQFSRGFLAFKVWLSLLAHGRRAYSRRISHDAALARYLAARVRERPDFELALLPNLSICCFRYVPPGLPDAPGRDAYLDQLNQRLMTEVQLDGRAYFSNAIFRGRFVLRVCIVNFRTEAPELDRVLDITSEIGGRLDARLRPPELRR